MDTDVVEPFCSFINTVFNELEFDDDLPISTQSIHADEDISIMTSHFVGTISFFKEITSSLHYYNLILFFRSCPFNLRNVNTLLTYHCEKIKKTCGNIFHSIFYAYSFVHLLSNFCKYTGFTLFQNQLYACCETLFIYVFKKEFDENDGMEGLAKVLLSPHEGSEFALMKSCYMEAGFFTTTVPNTAENKVFIYGKSFKEPFTVARERALAMLSSKFSFESIRHYLLELSQISESTIETIHGSDNFIEDLNPIERTRYEDLLAI